MKAIAIIAIGILTIAVPAWAAQVGDVFVIAMENQNWTQPNGNVNPNSQFQQLKGDPNAPFINSLVNGTATADIDGVTTDISAQTAYTSTYFNVDANAQGSVHIHPSEPNYIWNEAGTNFGILNDAWPFTKTGRQQNLLNTNQHLTGLLQSAGISWKAYMEDTDINTSTGAVLPSSQWTVPLYGQQGTYSGRNAYNGSDHYAYDASLDPEIFFTDTDGGDNTTASNPEAVHYAPVQQLQSDLNENTIGRFNWITPDMYNDMHTALPGGFEYHGKLLTGDSERIAQGDNFLSMIIPEIMASPAYQDNGAIIIRWDESEEDGAPGDDPDNFAHTLPEIVISPLAHANVNGLPYDSTAADYSHSSDLLTLQEIYQVSGQTPTGALGAAAGATSLANLFQPGAIPNSLPTPPPPLVWTNASGNETWDSAISPNWSGEAGTIDFNGGDDVSFSDSNGGDYRVNVAGTVNPSSVSVDNNSGDYVLSGSGEIADTGALTKSGAGELTLDASGSYGGGIDVSGGTLIAGTTAALGGAALRIGEATVRLAKNIGVVHLTSLSIASSGRLDIGNNEIILTHGTSDPIETIKQYVDSGFAGGESNGPGIDSSVAHSESGYAVGYADGKDGVVPGLAANQIELKFTLLGDATLSGTVNLEDLEIVEANLGKHVSSWDEGDFNGNGVVDFTDLADVLLNYGKTDTAVAAEAMPAVSYGTAMASERFSPAVIVRGEVPEPASVGMLVVWIAALSGRRYLCK